jgi:8-oxo-dGTP pyrophosphatase MutT (NUDIX family)
MRDERWIATPATTARIAERLRRLLAPPARAYEPWIVENHVVGWIIPDRAERLLGWRDVFVRTAEGIGLARTLDSALKRTAALAVTARALSDEGALTRWRDERYAVVPYDGGRALLELERAAARYFGIHTFAAHANGLVGDDHRWHMWLARRSPTKPIDPGLLDNLVGGGIAADYDATATLVKEAFEEAGVPRELARRARSAGTVDVCRDQPEGLQRETIHVYDLWLPPDFTPQNQDGEATGHRLCAPDAVLSTAEGDDLTADASLVIVDFLLRHGAIGRDDPSREALAALRHPARTGPSPPPRSM